MRTRSIVVVVLVLCTCKPWQRHSTERGGREAALDLAARYIACDQRADSSCAVELFHYPEPNRESPLATDKRIVGEGLTLLRERFGRVNLLNEQTDPYFMLELSWGGGTLDYWSKHPESVKVTYAADFDRYGPGFFQVEACHVGRDWQLRAVHYGLANSALTTQRIGGVGRELIALMRPSNST